MDLQPLLHDLLVAVAAPTQVWSARDGQIRAHGAQGLYEGDVRVLSEAVLTVGGAEPEVVAAGPAGRGSVEVVALVRGVDEDHTADPTVRLRRRRTVGREGLVETVEVTAATRAPVRVGLELALACDFAAVERVKTGGAVAPRAVDATTGSDGREPAGSRGPGPVEPGSAEVPDDPDAVLSWSDPTATVAVTALGAVVDRTDPARPVLRWALDVVPGRPALVTWRAATEPGEDAVVLAPTGAAPWAVPRVTADDPRLAALVARALDDLDGLRLRAAFAPDDAFLAAGAPWFFTLFGRDSLWAARMLLPLGTELAAGTLRTLAARQGAVVDPLTAEQPGKILHEVRAHELPLGEDGRVLPPLYYGTIDATPLWVCLLHDAWRWGMPAAEVEALLPAAERALAWMADHGDADGDGFLEYRDEGGHGLANQGWKDSGDSVQWRDGRLADGPIALCEVQAYAHEAALGGAALLDAFGRPGAERWRTWAARLAERFRASFWVADDDGPYPAIALDAAKRPVDSLTSNIGHLLGTGLLTPAEEAVVARRLGSAALDSGYGLRTMSTHEAGYWPLKYHGGSVWTHDTAIVVQGLVRAGHPDVAARLLAGLLAAAGEVDYRLAELHAGDERGTVPALVPYPAACRPQAWSAASGVAIVGALLGLEADVPAGAVRVRPTAPSPVGALEVLGLRVGGGALDVVVAADGAVRSARADAVAVHVDGTTP